MKKFILYSSIAFFCYVLLLTKFNFHLGSRTINLVFLGSYNINFSIFSGLFMILSYGIGMAVVARGWKKEYKKRKDAEGAVGAIEGTVGGLEGTVGGLKRKISQLEKEKKILEKKILLLDDGVLIKVKPKSEFKPESNTESKADSNPEPKAEASPKKIKKTFLGFTIK